MATSNPVFTNGQFSQFTQGYAGYDTPASYGFGDDVVQRSNAMTVQGTAVKALLLLAIVVATGCWSWNASVNQTLSYPLVMGAAIGGLVVGLITSFKPTVAPFTSPLYAALQGVFLGALSQIFEARYPGIAVNAVMLTCGAMFSMLALYSTRIIRVTPGLATGITAAIGAVMVVYLVSMLMSLFGMPVTMLHDSGPISIGFSLFVVGLASFSLLLDFDAIESGARGGAPKLMEWYGAFGLMVTLIWLYLEILKLLAKLQSRD